MEKVNRTSNLRIILSSIALASFVLFALCDNLMVREFITYHTYGWRLSVLNDLFLAAPFVALLIFSIMERKMRHINGRVFVAGIFVFYLVQAMLLWFSDGASEFSVFCCGFIGRLSEIVTAILIVRIVALLLIPIAHKNMLRFYSLGMIAFLVFALVATLTSDYISMRYSVVKTVITLSIDILFHVALFFFSNLLDKKNESNTWLAILGTFMFPIFGSIFDDDDYEDGEDYYEYLMQESKGEDNMSIYADYFSEGALKNIDTFDLGGENFLLDPPENAMLHIELERHDEATSVKGNFTHTFTEEQAARILKKKSVLNKTFEDISLGAETDANIGIESIEEGEFTITLTSKTFGTKDGYAEVRNYILKFMDAIILIQNTESYE